MAVPTQIFVRDIDGRSMCLQIDISNLTGLSLKQRIYVETLIPPSVQRLVSGTRVITDDYVLKPDVSGLFPSINLLLRLRGGKGGFGSLLRGAATKAGQKKTNNFDACRDMSGRRIRHVNAERKLEEWKAEAVERKLEKVSEEFLKKQTKKDKRRPSGDRSDNYLENYMEESSKSIDEVRAAVHESFGSLSAKGKGKVVEEEAQPSKRLKLWVLEEEDEEDGDSDDDVKSLVLDEGNSDQSESCEQDGRGSPRSVSAASGLGTDGASGSSSPRTNGTSSECDSPQNGRDWSGHNDAIANGSIASVDSIEHDSVMVATSEQGSSGIIDTSREEKSAIAALASCTLNHAKVELERTPEAPKMDSSLKEDAVGGSSIFSDDGVVNFDDFQTSKDMEVLGMERLKIELQARGLKCGGTFEQRAERLFMLKTMPIDMIPKKHLARTK